MSVSPPLQITLLVAGLQEVKIVPWLPPTASSPQQTADDMLSTVLAERPDALCGAIERKSPDQTCGDLAFVSCRLFSDNDGKFIAPNEDESIDGPLLESFTATGCLDESTLIPRTRKRDKEPVVSNSCPAPIHPSSADAHSTASNNLPVDSDASVVPSLSVPHICVGAILFPGFKISSTLPPSFEVHRALSRVVPCTGHYKATDLSKKYRIPRCDSFPYTARDEMYLRARGEFSWDLLQHHWEEVFDTAIRVEQWYRSMGYAKSRDDAQKYITKRRARREAAAKASDSKVGATKSDVVLDIGFNPLSALEESEARVTNDTSEDSDSTKSSQSTASSFDSPDNVESPPSSNESLPSVHNSRFVENDAHADYVSVDDPSSSTAPSDAAAAIHGPAPTKAAGSGEASHHNISSTDLYNGDCNAYNQRHKHYIKNRITGTNYGTSSNNMATRALRIEQTTQRRLENELRRTTNPSETPPPSRVRIARGGMFGLAMRNATQHSLAPAPHAVQSTSAAAQQASAPTSSSMSGSNITQAALPSSNAQTSSSQLPKNGVPQQWNRKAGSGGGSLADNSQQHLPRQRRRKRNHKS
ncbi:hypothetical protein CYLTODRAFT_412685 [Cylindrobasidium torrendii FP15055 ss-10]|uniref:Uncharacterized protein n=1 Tax=Cylindrobasidium torrendii FP15055 ss-10 TaxID=1314674 RepID=A0A0D7B495_9AGAR|nr:hypothetical protein CYLTODRAFT_412685 [Cylindrobasidium torrendii FP15055 ss-10]